MGIFSWLGDLLSKLWNFIKDNFLIILIIAIVLCFIFPAAAAALWAYISTGFSAIAASIWGGASAIGTWMGASATGLLSSMTLLDAVYAAAGIWMLIDPEGFGETASDIVGGVVGGVVSGVSSGITSSTLFTYAGLGLLAFVGYKLLARNQISAVVDDDAIPSDVGYRVNREVKDGTS